jgi:hypothetical protein
MRRALSLVIVVMLVVLHACKTSPDDPVPDTTPVRNLAGADLSGSYVLWEGRHHVREDDVAFYHTASGFTVSIDGRVLDITLGVDSYKRDIWFSVVKDGEDVWEADTFVLDGETKTFRVEFETYGIHHVKVIKRSEPEDGVTALETLSTNGTFLEVQEDRERPHVLIAGASGISGHGALGSQGQPRTTANSSSLHAFGYLAASHIGATVEFVANSGWGLLYGFNDTSGQTNISEAYGYVGIDADEKVVTVPWETEDTYDLVIANIGGNDFSSHINRLSGFARTDALLAFKDGVTSFILKLRHDAPDAHIIWTMTEGSLNGQAAREAVMTLDASDQAYVHFVTIFAVGEEGDPEGANNHAGLLTHQKSAQRITDVLETLGF